MLRLTVWIRIWQLFRCREVVTSHLVSYATAHRFHIYTQPPATVHCQMVGKMEKLCSFIIKYLLIIVCRLLLSRSALLNNETVKINIIIHKKKKLAALSDSTDFPAGDMSMQWKIPQRDFPRTQRKSLFCWTKTHPYLGLRRWLHVERTRLRIPSTHTNVCLPWWPTCNFILGRQRQRVPGTSWLPRLAELVSSELKQETLPIEISDGEWLGKTPHVDFWIPYSCAHMSTHTLERSCTHVHRHLKIHVQAHTQGHTHVLLVFYLSCVSVYN